MRSRFADAVKAVLYKKVGVFFAVLLVALPSLIALVPQEALAATPSVIFSDTPAFIIVSSGGNSAKFAKGASGGGTAPVKYTNPTNTGGSGCSGTITVPASTIQAGKGPVTLNNVKCGSSTFNNTYTASAEGTNPGTPAPPAKAQINWGDVKSAKVNSDGTQLTITFNDGSAVVFYNQDPANSKNYKPQPITGTLTLDGVDISAWCGNTQATPSSPNSSSNGVTLSDFTAKAKGTVNVCYDVGAKTVNQTPAKKIAVDASAYSSANGASTGTSSPTCQDSGFPGSWIFCTIIDGASQGMDSIYSNIIEPLLITKPIDLSGSSTDATHTYEVWSNFRVYGDIFLVIALLVIVFGESIGGGMIDAYTAKKILPRLLVAAILINLSIYIVALAVDLTNIIGNGLGNLLEAPFKAGITSGKYYVLQMSPITGTLGSGVTVATVVLALFKTKVVASGLMYLLVMVLIPAFFLFIAIMGTIVLRRGLILFLIFLSPVAFALYCLPNTEKYFRQWWDNLFKALLIYPIIAVMFALGNILSVTVSQSSSGPLGGAIASLVGMVSLFAPLFLIPFSFRIAGGLLGRFHELAKQGATMAHQGVRGNAQDPDSMRNRAKRRFAVERNEANLTGKATSRRLGMALSRPQDLMTTEGRKQRRGQLAAVREAGRQKLGGQFAESDPIYQANQKNDQYLLALANEGMAQQKRAAAVRDGKTTEVAAWDQAINSARATPKNASTRMRALNDLASTGFQFDAGQKGYDELARTVADITGVAPSELRTDPATGHITGATGTNAGVYANAMNNAQYGLRTAGRYDLGGINNGEGFSAQGGLNKASLYELANGKVESITTMVDTLPAGPAKEEHAVVYKELESMLPNAKGGVRDEIVKQMGVLEGSSVDVKKYMDQVVPLPPGPAPTTPVPTRVTFDNTNSAHTATTGPNVWTPEDRARGWRTENLVPPPPTETRGQQAQRKARAYERFDPNRAA